jgi:death on curing protein
MRIRPLTIAEAEFIAHRLAVELMDSENEPIPPFNTREYGKLESSLKEPFQTFGGRNLHRTFAERAAVLFYMITKNHCFSNGNKRMAVTLTTVFCFVNKRWFEISQKDLYDLSCSVAESHPSNRAEVHKVLVNLFKKIIKPLPEKYRIDGRRKLSQTPNRRG